MAGPTLGSHLSRTLLEDGGTWISGRSVIQWSGMRSVLIAGSPGFSPPGLMLPSSPESWPAIVLADPGDCRRTPRR